MEEQELLHQVLDTCKSFEDKCRNLDGVVKKCRKFGGAVTVEVLRHFLQRHGIPVSPRDVYINGLPTEIDLLIPRSSARPTHGMLYEPEQVLCVLEVKKLGSFGQPAVDAVKDNFRRVRKLRKGIQCAYVTLEERKSYKYRPTRGKIGFPCYTLFWHSGGQAQHKTPTRDWSKLVAFLETAARTG